MLAFVGVIQLNLQAESCPLFLFIPVKSTFHHINQSNNHSLKILIMLLV